MAKQDNCTATTHTSQLDAIYCRVVNAKHTDTNSMKGCNGFKVNLPVGSEFLIECTSMYERDETFTTTKNNTPPKTEQQKEL